MTSRRLWTLIKGLAADESSNTHRALGGEWSMNSLLLAAAIDDIRLGNYILAAANSPKGKNPLPLPVPIPRPGVQAPDNGKTTKRFGHTTKTPEEVAAILSSFNPPEENEPEEG